MRWLRRLGAGLLILLLAPLAAQARPAVLGVRLGLHDGFTRVVLDFTAAPAYRVFMLADPYRVVIDLNEVDWQVPGDRAPDGRGLVHAMRFGAFTTVTSRVVLDVTGPVGLRHVELLPAVADGPTRLVVDLQGVTPAAFQPAPPAAPDPSAGAGGAAPGRLVLPPLKPGGPGRPGKRTIAVDAGHGGVDPGAIGLSGTLEKTVTLAMAKELKRALEATGRYRVVLTRERDVFIRLRDRIALARAAHADLFVSLHADAHDNGDLRGASVYTLSEQASDAEAAALATKENKSDLIAGVDLSRESEEVTSILIDLAQRETKNLSARLAAMLVRELERDTLLLRNSHRFAGFAVLKAPDVPSILLELGYLSSRKDEEILRSPEHRARVGKAILRAVDAYFEWQGNLKRS